MARKWKHGGNWFVRRHEAYLPVNLNSEEGADYVLALQDELDQLRNAKRTTRRRKAGPQETKD